MKAVPQSRERERERERERGEWSGRTRKLGYKYGARLNTRVGSLDRDEWSGFQNMSPDVYYMELRSFLHISTTYMLILHFAACLSYSQEVYRLTERIYPTFIHISQWVTSVLNIRALEVVANTSGVVNFVATMLSPVQNTPLSTEYHVHLLQYDSQWSSYLSFEKPKVKLITVELEPYLDGMKGGAEGRLCVYAHVLTLIYN